MKFRAFASAGPMDKVLKDDKNNLRSFPDVMYEFYSWDARAFVADLLKDSLDNPPESFYKLTPELQDKSRGIMILELIAKFCDSAEDLAAFSIAFAAELYMNALGPLEVWKNLAEYETGDIVNFYRDIQRRGPDYFANLHGYPPLSLQEPKARMVLFRSCKQLAAYLESVAESYAGLRELHNAYKHGFRVFFGKVRDDATKQDVPAIAYIDEHANVNAISFSLNAVQEIYDRCSGIGRLTGAILYWHKLRMRVAKSGSLAVGSSPIFGQGGDEDKRLGTLYFPTLFEIRESNVAEAEKIAAEKTSEVSKIPVGHIIAVDIDLKEILPCHSTDLRDVLWKSVKLRPGARLALRRVTSEGKVGSY